MALSYEIGRKLVGTVEADDLYHTAGHKGQAHGGGKKALGRRARGRRKKREPGRGRYDKDRPAIIAWVSRQGSVVIQATRDCTVKTVQKAADLAVASHPHMLRHACGYALADQGADTRLIQDYLGHRNIQHTVMYTATNPARFERLWR